MGQPDATQAAAVKREELLGLAARAFREAFPDTADDLLRQLERAMPPKAQWRLREDIETVKADAARLAVSVAQDGCTSGVLAMARDLMRRYGGVQIEAAHPDDPFAALKAENERLRMMVNNLGSRIG